MLYMAGTAVGARFCDFPLITMHMAREALVPSDTLPLLYALAMLIDAFAALFFGCSTTAKESGAHAVQHHFGVLFDIRLPVPFASLGHVGIIMWGVGMGAQESILKSVVATIVSKQAALPVLAYLKHLLAYCGSWEAGSWRPYDSAPIWLVIFSVCAQLAAIPFFFLTSRFARSKDSNVQNL
jgi:hypothetical protein